jgi:hypothetical protein
MGEQEHMLHAYYSSLTPIFCPVLNDTVYFSSVGLTHLLYRGKKRRTRRSTAERIYRLSLLRYVPTVIQLSTKSVKLLKSAGPSPVITWALTYMIRDTGRQIGIKVILIRKGEGKLYFLSVMRISKKPR